MRNIICLFFVLSTLFCGCRAEKKHEYRRKAALAEEQAHRSFTNFFPENNRNWHVGLEGSYLYWMIGTHTTYANVYKTTRATYMSGQVNQPNAIAYIDEDLVGIIAGSSKANSGYSARVSIFNEKMQGWEFGVKYQQIDYKDDPLNCCQRIFTDNEWYEYSIDPNVRNFPIPAENNGLIAKVNILLPESFVFTNNDFYFGPVVYQLDNIYETLDFKSVVIDLTNFGLLHSSKYFNFGLSTGLELDWFKNKIKVRGAASDFVAHGALNPSIFLCPFSGVFFAYKLENTVFSIGPFVSVEGAFRFERPKHVFQINGSLYGAGLYTKNRYIQDVGITRSFDMILAEWQASNQGTAPSSIYPQSSCEVQYTKPELCYNPRTTMYHAKITLGVDYEFFCKGMESHISVDWETNSFLNFFDRDFKVFSYDDLNYQGLTATVGFAF